MYHAAHHFAERFRQESPEILGILCSSMMDLSVLKALIGSENIHYAYYMHENQLLYPKSPSDRDSAEGRDHHYSFMQLHSCAAAERVFFNSEYHLDAWYEALKDLLDELPSDRKGFRIAEWNAKSEVAYIPLDLSPFLTSSRKDDTMSGPVKLLWNHRWEYDKGPEDFFELLQVLEGDNIDFRLIMVGTRGRNHPRAFDDLRNRFSKQIIHIGEADTQEEYVRLLSLADILPVTSYQDFFGISIVEAMAAGVVPILPDRLSYPELLGSELSHLLYPPGEIASRIPRLHLDPSIRKKVKERARFFHDFKLEQRINDSM